MRPTTAVITMAGRGQRFRDAGYAMPKFEIRLSGHSLLTWSMLSLQKFIQNGCRFVFISRKEDNADNAIARTVETLSISSWSLLELEETTDGQATTALAAKDLIDDLDSPFFVYNIDTHVQPEYIHPPTGKLEGWIPCFPARGDHWSFVKIQSDSQRVIEVREKQRISPHATIGLYWFGSFRVFEQAYRSYYADSQRVEKGEKYIAPLYNDLIRRSMSVEIDSIPTEAIYPMGTPEEVDYLESTGGPPWSL